MRWETPMLDVCNSLSRALKDLVLSGMESESNAEGKRSRTTISLSPSARIKLKALKEELGFRTRPVIITGESGAGKTTALKSLISRWTGSVFVLDVTGEYPEFNEVGFVGVFSTPTWQKDNQRVRFVTNQESVEAARGEASSIFGHLNYLKNAGKLKKWVIVVEEGYRFTQDPNLRALLIEGRKFCRKVILVTTDHREFSGIAKTFKP
jgi:hypothetical protein